MISGNFIWKPSVTVAAIVERAGRFLLVEEKETACAFEPTGLLGVYQYHSGADDVTYIRFAFTGAITGPESGRALDAAIIRAVWLAPEEIRREVARHRSPLVMRCIDDYLSGCGFPLDVLYHHPH